MFTLNSVTPVHSRRVQTPAPALQAAARSNARLPRVRAVPRGPVRVRADVNWDAFRPTVVSSGYAMSGVLAAKKPRNMASRVPGGGSVQQVDFLLIGSGIAGLSYALKVAQYGSVAVVTKDYANEGCTQYAQGGVCAVLDQHDSVSEHARDTMIAGAFLNVSK